MASSALPASTALPGQSNPANPLKDAKQTALDLSALAEKEALALANSKRNEIKEIRNHK